ncbi:A/G-specific adenine glycosylase [Leptolyngbya sp. AN02str]|uniref:A/G-specific adenine glycosylase n=1 Tax=Leptolyngbya sp. AN02str TaxID=3423363 RepID=UPI003D31B020
MPAKSTSSAKAQQNSASSNQDLPSFVVAELRDRLLQWYAKQGRDLPWRRNQNPYHIWISEIMLQQTQVKTVIPYYERWLQAFPTVEALAAASQEQVLKQWEGLGYYARARNLHKAAQAIAHQHNGQFPTQFEAAIALPGIGRTTAGGILSAAFNQPVPILDGNVKRVLARLTALQKPPNRSLEWLWQCSTTLLDPVHSRDFNQALMDLGATLCTPRHPNCGHCPWSAHCRAYALTMQNDLPVSETRSPIPHKVIGVAVIWNDSQQILIDRRRQEGLLGGLWEFPGGKVEPNETIEHCIRREIQEELGIEIEVGDRLTVVDHTYSHFRVTLNVHHCHHVSGIPQPLECDEVRWVTLNELDQYPFPKANIHIIEALKQVGPPSSVNPSP